MNVCVNCEGQILLSFALGVLFSPYTYRIFWLAVFLMIFEIGYWLVFGEWFIKLRLGLIVAYILGLMIGLYAIEESLPFI